MQLKLRKRRRQGMEQRNWSFSTLYLKRYDHCKRLSRGEAFTEILSNFIHFLNNLSIVFTSMFLQEKYREFFLLIRKQKF